MPRKRQQHEEVPLGSVARERFTGFTGLVVQTTSHITGCAHRMLEPLEMVNGEIIRPSDFDVTRLVLIPSHPKAVVPDHIQRPNIPLEALVEDVVTGVQGVVLVVATNLFGCPEYLIQPCGLTPKGEPMTLMMLEEGRLRMLAEKFGDITEAEPEEPAETEEEPPRRGGIAHIEEHRRR